MSAPSQANYYQDHLLRDRADYDHDYQLYLKRRVIRTFDRLMRLFAGRPLAGRVLDTGAARGEFADVCREQGLEAATVGIETGIHFERDAFPFSTASFDVVCGNSVIEHLHDPTLYLTEINRVLNRDGHVILVTPHWPYAARHFYDVYTHVQPYSARSLGAVFRCHGFAVSALVPWVVDKSDLFWRLPGSCAFRLAAWLPFTGLNRSRLIPGFLKGRSATLLALGRKERDI